MFSQPFDIATEFPALFKQIVEGMIVCGSDSSKDKSYTEVVALIQRNLFKILQRLQMPYIDESESSLIQQDLFFQKLCAKLQAVAGDHKLKVFVGGGVVRALLAYLYKELLEETRKHDEDREVTETGGYKSLAQFMRESMHDPEYHLRRLSMLRETERLYKEFVLGIGSDLDIYLELDPPNETLEAKLIQTATDFINSVETRMNLRDLKGVEKHTFLPIADVKMRRKQLISSQSQGGPSIDWLSLELTTPEDDKLALRSPEFIDFNIMYDLIDGFYRYLEGVEPAKQKQVIRGLRALFEIPFLSINDVAVIEGQLAELDMSKLETDAKEQLDKLLRNAYMNAAHNRAYRDHGLLSKLAAQRAIPIFATNSPLSAKRHVRGRHAAMVDAALMNNNVFLEVHCDNSEGKPQLHQGTKDPIHALYMLRGGFVISVPGVQGSAHGGSGLYVTNDPEYAFFYSGISNTDNAIKDGGIRVSFEITANKHMRVLVLSHLSDRAALEREAKEKGFPDLYDLLREYYNIDIILHDDELADRREFIIQNTSVIALSDHLSFLMNIGNSLLHTVRNYKSGGTNGFSAVVAALNFLGLLTAMQLQDKQFYIEYKSKLSDAIKDAMTRQEMDLEEYLTLSKVVDLLPKDYMIAQILVKLNSLAEHALIADVRLKLDEFLLLFKEQLHAGAIGVEIFDQTVAAVKRLCASHKPRLDAYYDLLMVPNIIPVEYTAEQIIKFVKTHSRHEFGSREPPSHTTGMGRMGLYQVLPILEELVRNAEANQDTARVAILKQAEVALIQWHFDAAATDPRLIYKVLFNEISLDVFIASIDLGMCQKSEFFKQIYELKSNTATKDSNAAIFEALQQQAFKFATSGGDPSTHVVSMLHTYTQAMQAANADKAKLNDMMFNLLNLSIDEIIAKDYRAEAESIKKQNLSAKIKFLLDNKHYSLIYQTSLLFKALELAGISIDGTTTRMRPAVT